MGGAIKSDSVYNDATLASKALSDGACAVVAGSLFHNLTVLWSFNRVKPCPLVILPEKILESIYL